LCNKTLASIVELEDDVAIAVYSAVGAPSQSLRIRNLPAQVRSTTVLSLKFVIDYLHDVVMTYGSLPLDTFRVTRVAYNDL